jgi:hypothetical protein
MPKVRFPGMALVGAAVLGLTLPPPVAAAQIYFSEDFASAPAQRGWQVFGATNLFAWNPTNQNMEVTWDSSQTNSLFCHPLDIVLSKTNDFILGFDLCLADVATGTAPDKPESFQVAVGLTELASATNASFRRGTGFDSPNLVEFDYFPDAGYGATVATAIISSSNEWNAGGLTWPLALTLGDVFHVELRYVAASQTLMTRMTRNGAPFGPLKPATLGAGFSDFRVDQMAVSSYSDAGQDPSFAGSILAHGTVDNFVFICPPPVGDISGGFVGETWQVRFRSLTNWQYRLERTDNFQSWAAVSETVAGSGYELVLADNNAPAGKAFYRVQAARP